MAAISPLTLIFQAVDQVSPVVKNIIAGLKENIGVVGALSLAYNETQQAIASFAAQGQKAYDLLIGQNVELQNQLLSTQASLAATNKVISNGFEVSDPTKAIQALTEPVNQAIAELRKGSFDLVGVTSSQLVPLFQSVANESSKIGANLHQSAELALGFGAATQTLKIPLEQTSNELKLILEGQVSSENRLATALNLNNETVNKWKAQGVFVEELNKKLAVFRAGNALGAQTIDGITVNIKDLVQEFARIAGVPLLQPIVNQLNVLYEFLKQNREEIQGITVSVVNFFLQIGQKLGEAVKALQPVLATLGQALFTEFSTEASVAANIITGLIDAFVALVKASAPLLQVLANITLLFAELGNSPIGQIVIETGALLAIASTLLPVILAVGVSVASLISGLLLVGESIASVAVAAGGVSGILAAIASGGFPALGAAALGAIPTLEAFATAATAAIAPLLPIIALGGAIALTLTIVKTGDLRVANDELEEFRQQNELLSDQSIGLATNLKALNDVEIANGKLTEDEAKRRRGLQEITRGQVEALKSQIDAIKEVQPASEEQKQNQEAQIGQLQQQVDLLNKLSGGTKLTEKDVQILGNTYEQLGKKIAEAQSQFDRGGGGLAVIFNKAAGDLVKLTDKQVELGKGLGQEAIARLEKVRDDSRVEYEVQLSAQEAITKIRQGEVDKRVKTLEGQQQKIQVSISDEVVSQSLGQKEITEVKLKELNLQLQATEAAIKSESDLRKKQVDEQVGIIEGQITEAQKRLAEAQGKGDKGGTRIATGEIAKLEAQKSTAQASLQVDSDHLSQLKSQQQKFSTEIAQTQGQERQRVRQEQIKDYDEQQQILDSQNAQRLITQEQFNQQSLQIAQDRAKTELTQLAEQRGKLAASDKEGLEMIAAKEAQVRQKLAESIEKFEVDKSKARIAAVDTEQKQLADKLAEGEVTQQQFNQQSLSLTQKRLQAELDEIKRQREKLKAGDTQRSNELNAQEADIRKRSVDAIAQNQEAQVTLIQQAQKRATDIVSQSESDRLTEITRLEAAQTIRKVEAEKLRTDATGDRIKKELQLEKDNLAQLEALPSFSDPNKEEARQAQIRVSRLKTSQLTKSLIDNEIQQREAAFRVIEDGLNREIQGIQNTANAQNQALEKQEQLQDFISKSLENQIKLLESRKNLISSVAGFYQGELDVLKETTKNQREQKQLAETGAEIRLNSARASFEIEKQITKEKIEQQQIDLAIKELELRGEQAGASSATLKAQAEQKKVESKPGATQEEKDAAALDVQAAQSKELGLQFKGALLGQEQVITAAQGQQELDNLERTQQLQDDQNVAGLANARVNKGQGRRELKDLRDNILKRGGTNNARNFGKGLNFNTVGGGLISQLSQLQAILQGVLPSGTIPQTTRRLRPARLAQRTNQTTRGDTQAIAPIPVGTINITISNQFTDDDATTQKAADKVTQDVRKELYDLGVLLTRQTN
ncbi:MAG: hypothetical protein V7L23_31635 [Nostoc sp.]|uniref:hypothetical protein n=1 Tax=Nostoc sp. TaxID=1180 RepID=UPI002FF00C36